jgi:hypothetical protein
MPRKLLTGGLALAVSIGPVVIGSSAASAGGPSDPITCASLSVAVTFGTPLSVSGTTTSLKKGGPPTSIGAGTFTCPDGTIAPPFPGTSPRLMIPTGKNTKVSKGVYKTGRWSQFAVSGGRLRGTFDFTIDGGPVVFKATRLTVEVHGACAGDVGFMITGRVTGNFANKSADMLACFGTDTHVDTTHGSFPNDYTVYNGVVAAQSDPAASRVDL